MDWNSLNLIEYSILDSEFEGNRFSGKKSCDFFHLYIPWQESHIEDLMFQFKKNLVRDEKVFIPVMKKDLTATVLTDTVFNLISDQLERGVETHLYMSNLDSIHIWKIKKIHKAENMADFEKDFEGKTFKLKDFYQWIEIEDLFVYKANHSGSREEVIRELEDLKNKKSTHDLFCMLNRFKKKEAHVVKWINLKRELSYDYFMRASDLKENIYAGAWDNLTRLTQHYLVLSDQYRHLGIMNKNNDKVEMLKGAFEQYHFAIISELNEIYIYPICELYYNYSSVKEAWGEISSMTNPQIRMILNNLFEGKESGIHSLNHFLIYFQFAKSFLFSMKTKFAKKIGREEFLIIENALSRQENLIDSFISKHMDKKIKNLVSLKEYIEIKNSHFDTLKLAHILSLLSSTSPLDNLFFKIIEEKTSRRIVKRSLEEEIENLLEIPSSFKIAA